MKCPRCQSFEDKVVESRTLVQGSATRRRRECLNCGYRFTSYERIEEKPLMVIKTNGRREPFDRQKLERGIRRAVEKRPIGEALIETMLNTIEDKALLLAATGHEIESAGLGDLVLKELRLVDKVAYIRFASVYQKFSDLQEFIRTIQSLEKSATLTKTTKGADATGLAGETDSEQTGAGNRESVL